MLHKVKYLYNMATVLLQWLCLKTDYFNNIYNILYLQTFFDTLFYFCHFERMVFDSKVMRNVGWMQKEKDCYFETLRNFIISTVCLIIRMLK